MGKGTEPELLPRAEARPLHWGQLTTAQREVGRKILRYLHGMAHQDLTSDACCDRRSLVQLEPRRHNRVLLIDGSRGAGKTALLVTVLQKLQAEAEQYLPWRGAAGDDEDDKDPDWDQEGKPSLGDVLVLPVALIDLAPLPRRSNLLLLFVSCLERVVQRIEQKAGVASWMEQAPWQPEASDQLPCRVTWQRLANAVVQGWDETTAQLARSGDLESHARETMNAEDQRLELPNRIREFLQALSDDFRRHFLRAAGRGETKKGEKQLLFLLAVDDADMNPERIDNLVDALRLFAHQRLAFILTGDSRLFRRNLEYSSVSGQRNNLKHSTLPKDNETDLWQSSHVLARQIYDKLIPAPQRCGISPLPAVERLAFRLCLEPSPVHEQTGKPEHAANDSLRKILDNIIIIENCSFANLLERLPWLCNALPGHMRALIDFFHFMQTRQHEVSETKALVRAIEALWQSSIMECEIRTDMARKLVGNVHIHHTEIALNIHAAGMSTKLDWAPSADTRKHHRTSVPPNERLGMHAVFCGVEPGPQVRSHEHFPAIAALLLASLVAEARGVGDVRAESGRAAVGSALPLAFGSLRIRKSPAAGVDADPGTIPDEVRVPWPLPERLSLIQQLVLVLHWANLLHGLAAVGAEASAGTRELSPDAQKSVVAFFIAAVCKLAAAHDNPVEKKELFMPPSRDYATALVGLTRLMQHDAPLDPADDGNASFSSWALGQVGLLAAPESGLDPALSNQFLRDLRQAMGEERWVDQRRHLSEARLRRLAQALGVSAAGALSQPRPQQAAEALRRLIDDGAGVYDWCLSVESYAERLFYDLAQLCDVQLAPQTLSLLLTATAAWLRGLESLRTKNATERLAQLLDTALQPAAHVNMQTAQPLKTARDTLEREQAALSIAENQSGKRSTVRPDDRKRMPASLLQTSLAAYAVGEPVYRQIEGQLLPASAYTVRAPMFEIGADSLPPLVRGLWQLQHDHRWHTMKNPSVLRVIQSAHFPAVAVQIDLFGTHIQIPWPTLRWPSFASAGRLATQWNEALTKIKSAVPESAGRTLIDALGYFYIDLSLAIAQGRRQLPELSVRPLLPKDWLHLLDGIERIHFSDGDRSTNQALAVPGEGIPQDELWEFLVAMAAPESGLSYQAVRSLLMWFQNNDADNDRQRRALEARDQRWLTLVERKPAWWDGSAFVDELRKRVASLAREAEHPAQSMFDGLANP